MSNTVRKEIELGEGGQVKSFIGPKDMKEGQELSGVYRGTFETEGKFGKQTVHKLETASGAVGLNSSGMLNKKLALVSEGTPVTIIYEGKQAIKKGKWKGTEAHQFRVIADLPESDDDYQSEEDL